MYLENQTNFFTNKAVNAIEAEAIKLTEEQKVCLLCAVCEMTKLGLTHRPCQLYYEIERCLLCKKIMLVTELDFHSELEAIRKRIYAGDWAH